VFGWFTGRIARLSIQAGKLGFCFSFDQNDQTTFGVAPMKKSKAPPADGPTKEYFAGELSAVGAYRGGKRHGPWKFYYVNGQLKAEGKFAAGQLDGRWKWWRENGQLLQAGAFEDGKQTGLWKRYYDNGQLIDEGRFAAGKKVGPWKCYSKSGKLERAKVFQAKR